ncbi:MULTISPECIES: class I SAM-dependent DNA methyltransferase [Terrabacteria group]|uniref:HsdM family class I SAM-dependent methyltransferase n=1 Tax=Bacillati TaxID=1783272 RepID=UPI001C6F4015|nr:MULTISPECIES: N-6 DNA methylase [Terrabacteria group]MBW9212425.1 SAM-dependent methyltransferase [Trueperella sp. zg.1013]
MQRDDIGIRIGKKYRTSNIEGGEFSYVQAAGSKEKLVNLLGYDSVHFKVDIRFENKERNVVVLVETKQNYDETDKEQLRQYVDEEKVLFKTKKIIAILANTNNDKFKIWKNKISDETLLQNENVIDTMEYYTSLFNASKQNDREKVLKNTYALNELLHKKDIPEKLRSQFVGTSLLYIKDEVKRRGYITIDDKSAGELSSFWSANKPATIITAIKTTLDELLDGSDNKIKKVELLQKNVLNNQKVKSLNIREWDEILSFILKNIYAYIDEDSDEGQDILNLFFIAFNKYTGKADKNQAFTPDHITEFMCRVTEVDRNKRVFDGTCGSGSFLVQAMVKELADCEKDKITDLEKRIKREKIKKNNIYGVEIEEVAFGLSTTNMLIHGDGNSNIKLGSLFDMEDFFVNANPDIILMNPPYNAKPRSIPDKYKAGWNSKQKDGKEDPTKGFVFAEFISDCLKNINDTRINNGQSKKEIKLAILLPVAAAIGSNSVLQAAKENMLEENTLEAVFTLPNEVFYPGASVSACCMVFTLGRPHKAADGTIKETFFGYYKDDGFIKRKNLGRVEQFSKEDNSVWKDIEKEWLNLFRNKKVVDGLSATAPVTHEDEWLAEAYMKTDYSTLTEADFEKTIRDYYSYLIKNGGF